MFGELNYGGDFSISTQSLVKTDQNTITSTTIFILLLWLKFLLELNERNISFLIIQMQLTQICIEIDTLVQTFS